MAYLPTLGWFEGSMWAYMAYMECLGNIYNNVTNGWPLVPSRGRGCDVTRAPRLPPIGTPSNVTPGMYVLRIINEYRTAASKGLPMDHPKLLIGHQTGHPDRKC